MPYVFFIVEEGKDDNKITISTEITGGYCAGGVAGSVNKGELQYVSYTGTIKIGASIAGGLIGLVDGGQLPIKNCNVKRHF